VSIPGQRYLYLAWPTGRAMRYGIGVGRQGFQLERRRHDPAQAEMAELASAGGDAGPRRARTPMGDGMPGGPTNPLGARALYLYQNGRDTLYRIHGTNEPQSIGRAVSSGCIRMLNADVIDLYERVPHRHARVVLRPQPDGAPGGAARRCRRPSAIW
jgi:lipoprotein-anchoring transpeptidase ErfK/SrfK